MTFMYKPTLPKWNEDLAYLFGLLLGDGSLPLAKTIRPNGRRQTRYLIYFISNSLDFVNEVYIPLFQKLFSLTPKAILVKNKKNPLYNCRIESKMVYEFLRENGFTVGRKAKIASIPKIMPAQFRIYLLAGLLDTDGGKKGNGFGLSTASKYLAEFCIEIFQELQLKHHSCPWHYNDHIYHQIYVPKREMLKLLKAIPLKNKEKINFIETNTPQ